MSAADPQYYISEGVRRSVAARELGMSHIRAKLEAQGSPDRTFMVPLKALHAPRDVVIASDLRYRNVYRGLSVAPDRVPVIHIAPLAESGQGRSYPLAVVRLEL